MRRLTALALALALLAAPAAVEAQQRQQPASQRPPAQAAQGQDHPLVGRYEGSQQRFRQVRDYEETRFPTAAVRNRQGGQPRLDAGNSVEVAGKLTRLVYTGPVDRSPLEVVRNLQERLERLGFAVVFACRMAECGGSGSDLWFGVVSEQPIKQTIMPSNWEGGVYVLLRWERAEGDVWVSLYAVPNAPGGGPATLIDVVETKGMERDKVVVVSADEMARAIAASGKVALYGILFDTDRADPRPDSRPAIEEIAKYLRANPQVAVIVVGHTDSQGGFDYNVDLSRRRAAAVVAILTREFGIAPARLTAFGAGMAAPVASNDTAEGKAQNRRVEVVKR